MEGAERLLPQKDIFTDCQCRDQHEVLVNHAGSQTPCIERGGGPIGLPVQCHRPLIGNQQAEQDIHQSRFPGAVFSQQGMDLSPLHPQVCLIQGADPAKSFADIVECEKSHKFRHPPVSGRILEKAWRGVSPGPSGNGSGGASSWSGDAGIPCRTGSIGISTTVGRKEKEPVGLGQRAFQGGDQASVKARARLRGDTLDRISAQ
ncbi:MAG: hypothetical protein UZ16_OP3001003572 [Candidatus Hinthialibacteria bacterium OLB16]|nr:MAG: hypothetical protein UZ16_OP3001003572 [Candidatus Hinthialibacteria bacterium OLB16]